MWFLGLLVVAWVLAGIRDAVIASVAVDVTQMAVNAECQAEWLRLEHEKLEHEKTKEPPRYIEHP